MHISYSAPSFETEWLEQGLTDGLDDVALAPTQLDALYAVDDRVPVALDGQMIELEQATLEGNPAFDLIGLTQLRSDPRFADIDGTGVSVAVLDTGLFQDHPFLSPNYVTGVDFVDGDEIPNDLDGHGTHVAGTIGATDENIGVAPDVGLIGLRVLSQGGGTLLPIRNALQWVLDHRDTHNIVAVNMSLGIPELFLTSSDQISGGTELEIRNLVQQLEEVGVTVVSAAGNDYSVQQQPGITSPAIFSTLNVGAVWQNDYLSTTFGQSSVSWASGAIDFDTGPDLITSFSQRLVSDTTLFAPGAFITSTLPPKGDGQLVGLQGGTSQASPHVAGAVALLQEAAFEFGGRYLMPDEVVDILRTTADTISDQDDADGDGVRDDNVENTNAAYPRLNIFNAVEELFNRFQGNSEFITDPDGTIATALLGPSLTGVPVNRLTGTLGSDGGVEVGDSDVDIFRFEVLSPGLVTLETGTDPDNPNDVDTFLRLFNQAGSLLDSDDDGGSGTFSKLEIFLSPGIYSLGVSGFGNSRYNPNVAGSGTAGNTGHYSLQFSLDSPDPNGLIAGALPIRLDRDPLVLQEGRIGTDFGDTVGGADVDLFQITVPDNGTLFIDIDTPFVDGFVDSYLRLFDAEGNELFVPGGEPFESNDDLAFDATPVFTEFTDSRFPDLVFEDPVDRSIFHGHTTDSFLGALVERGDVYYVGVSDVANRNYDPKTLDSRSDAGGGGLYNLAIEFVNNDLDGSIDQAVQTVALPLLAQQGNIGSDQNPITGVFQNVGDLDVDFVRINSPQAGVLEVDVDSFADPATVDPVDTALSIFDSSGTVLAENDDTDSLDPLIQLEIDANTDYYVAVSGFGNDSFDPFLLGSGAAGDTGNYVLTSRLLTRASLSSLSNDQINHLAVTAIALNGTVDGDIGTDDSLTVGATDIDLYRLVPEETVTVSIRTFADEAFAADTVLRLFDAAGNELAFNDDENEMTLSSLIQTTLVAGQEYFIGVNGYSPDARAYDPLTGIGAAPGSQGRYVLSVTTEGGPVDDGATPDAGSDNDVRIGSGMGSDAGSEANTDAGSETGSDVGSETGTDADTGVGSETGSDADTDVGSRTGSDAESGIDSQGSDGPSIVRAGGITTESSGSEGNSDSEEMSDGVIRGTAGNDRLVGTGRSDRILGFAKNDRLIGKGGNDVIFGGGGSDILVGGAGNDQLVGGGGSDILRGGAGKDVLNGSGGSDRIDGGKGSDTIITGGGRDRILIRKKQGFDRVRDFKNNQDKIDLKGMSFEQLTLQERQGDVIVKLGGQNLLRLENIALSQIDQTDFI